MTSHDVINVGASQRLQLWKTFSHQPSSSASGKGFESQFVFTAGWNISIPLQRGTGV